MTIKELEEIEELLYWARGKVMSQHLKDKIVNSLFNIHRDLKYKKINPIDGKEYCFLNWK